MTHRELTKLFKDTDINLYFGDGHVNFFLDNGVNCEFYGDSKKANSYDYLTATYTLDENTPDEDFFFELPEDAEGLLTVISQILDVGRKDKLHDLIAERN